MVAGQTYNKTTQGTDGRRNYLTDKSGVWKKMKSEGVSIGFC